MPGVGVLLLTRGVPWDLGALDGQWLGLVEKEEDESDHWLFHTLGKGRAERFCVKTESGQFMGVWLDHDPLVCGDAYQVDFLKRRPGTDGAGLGKYLMGMVALRALEKAASRIVFQPLAQAEKFFMGIGAVECLDWQGPESLLNLQLPLTSLTSLSELLKPYEQQHAQSP